VGQFDELIDPVPAAAVSAGARASTLAITPGALDAAGVDTCEPGAPASDHVARTPENGIAHAPDPDPRASAVPRVHTLRVAVATQV